MTDVVGEIETLTGRRVTPLEYDLSDDELTEESARNFYEVYGGAYGDDRITLFAMRCSGSRA